MKESKGSDARRNGREDEWDARRQEGGYGVGQRGLDGSIW
jgi:hypothetical protein